MYVLIVNSCFLLCGCWQKQQWAWLDSRGSWLLSSFGSGPKPPSTVDVHSLIINMEEELQELRELVAQLKVDNERMRQRPNPGDTDTSPTLRARPGAPVAERLVFVPRDRKCPMFKGKSGMKVNEWLEEVEACMRAHHLSVNDQAFFLFDHLEGEAKEEITRIGDRM